MALVEIDRKIVNVSPPRKLTALQKKRMDEAPVANKLISRALSRKFKVVTPRHI